MPDEEERKNIVVIGRKTYVFESEMESKAFLKLIRVQRVPLEDAYKQIIKLRMEGFFGGDSDDENDDLDFEG